MGFLIGGVIGVAIAYIFFFSFFEKIAWDIFFTGIQNFEFIFSWNDLKTSSTFWKAVAGFIVGGIVGLAVEDAININNKKDKTVEKKED
jgi:hypothetical protein